MKVLLSIIISTIGALGNLTFVLVIVIYIFAVIGMQLFSKDYTADKFYPEEVPRWNFTDFFHSFMMIFRILCGEWIEPLWDCMRAESTEVGVQNATVPNLQTSVAGSGHLPGGVPADPSHGQLHGAQLVLGLAAQQFQLGGA